MGFIRTDEIRRAEIEEFRRMLLSCSGVVLKVRSEEEYNRRQVPAANRDEYAVDQKLVCVTSGVSFLGIALVKKLLLRGYSVRIIVDNEDDIERLREIETAEETTETSKSTSGNRIGVVVAKFNERQSLMEAFDGCCAVFHTAALIDPSGLSGYSELETGVYPTRGQIYIKGHTRKKDNGKIVSKKVSEVMASLQAISGESSSSGSVDDVADFSNDDYSQVKGPEKSGYIRCVGRMPAVKKVASSRKDPDPTMEELKNVMGVMGAMIHQHYPNSNLLEVLNKMNIKIPSCNSSAESRNVSG